MDRFDIPSYMKDFLNKALEVGLLDASDIFALGSTFGTDWVSLRDNVMESAYVQRHVDGSIHTAMCIVNDAAYSAESQVKA